VAKGRKVNSAPNVEDLDSIGKHVKVEDAGIDIDLSQGFVEPTKGLYVREDFAGFVRQVKPASGGVLGKGVKYVKPASPRSLASYDVAVFVRALGTSGMLVSSTTIDRQRIVEHFNYIRPTAKYANAVMQAVALAKELTNRGVPWTALVIVYPTPGTKLKRPMVLHVRGIKAYYRRIHTSAGTYYSPDVRLYFTRHVLGLRKGTPYIFDLIILYSTKPLQKPASKVELVEQAMARIPPPQIQVVQAQPQVRRKARAHVRAVEAQPEAQPTAQARPAPAVEAPQAQPKPQPAKPAPQPAVQARPTAQPQVRPATLSTGKYVKEEQRFMKEVVSAPSAGESTRAIRQGLENRMRYVREAQPEAQTVEGKRRYVTEAQEAQPQPAPQPQPVVQAQPEANNGLSDLDNLYMQVVQWDSQLSPEEKVRLVHKWFEEARKKVNI